MASTVAVPSAGSPTFAYVRSSSSASVHARVPVWSASSAPELVSAAQTGASLTPVTVIDIVIVLEFTVPSLARNVKLSVPWKSGSGL